MLAFLVLLILPTQAISLSVAHPRVGYAVAGAVVVAREAVS